MPQDINQHYVKKLTLYKKNTLERYFFILDLTSIIELENTCISSSSIFIIANANLSADFSVIFHSAWL